MSFINYKISMDPLGWWPHRWLSLILAILYPREPKGVKRRAQDPGTKPAAALQCLRTRKVHTESGVITQASKSGKRRTGKSSPKHHTSVPHRLSFPHSFQISKEIFPCLNRVKRRKAGKRSNDCSEM